MASRLPLLASAWLPALALLASACVPTQAVAPPPVPVESKRQEVARPAIIPARAAAYRAALLREVAFSWPGDWSAHPVVFAQIHQESAWRPGAESRFAAGLAQFTPDTARWIQGLYPRELREFCGEARGCPMDPRWALRAVARYDRRLWGGYGFAPERDEQYAFMLAAYNGGPGWILRERASARAAGADPDRWFGGVEAHCLRAAWACEENREYPEKILFRLRPAYRAWLGLDP